MYPRPQGELFPGLLPVALAVVGIVAWAKRGAAGTTRTTGAAGGTGGYRSRGREWLARVFLVVSLLYMVLATVVIYEHRIAIKIGPVTTRANDVTRLLAFAAGALMVAMTLSRRARSDPLFMLAHYGLGQASMELKQYRAAIRAFIGCREAFRQWVMLEASSKATVERLRREELTELRDSLRQIKKPGVRLAIENRIRDLEAAQQRDVPGGESRTPAEVSLALGSAYFRAGDIADAEREYRQAIRVKPRLGEAHNNLAVVLMRAGRLAEAEHELNLAEEAGFRVNAQFKGDLRAWKQVARLK